MNRKFAAGEFGAKVSLFRNFGGAEDHRNDKLRKE